MSSDLHIVALLYSEPYYRQTVECLNACGFPVTFTERHKGSGSLSYAMNRGFEKVEPKAEFVWFTTDITFEPETPKKLLAAFSSNPDLSAIHPAHPSDHVSHRPDGSDSVRLVPYLEFTAPMWRAADFRECGLLDENHWYWYQDLLISREARLRGKAMAVHHGTTVGHVYRRSDAHLHPVTRARYELRKYRDKVEQRLLQARFGPNWREVLWASL
jgi:GT2 family glycosyltransferase